MVENKWICDKCREPIMTIEEGWLKWTKNLNDETLSGFKIIHHPACKGPGPKIQKSGLTAPGDPLKEFQGEDGLIRLLELLSKTEPENQSELLEIIQRIHIPGYEAARPYFKKENEEGRLVPAVDGVYYPTVKKIQEINKQYQ